jgi:hypothetical protein
MIFVPFGSTYRVLACTETGLPHCGGGLVDDGLGQDAPFFALPLLNGFDHITAVVAVRSCPGRS